MSLQGKLRRAGIDDQGHKIKFTKGISVLSQELTVSGAITSRGEFSFVELNHIATIIAATLAAPVKGLFLVITDSSLTGTAAHTVTLTTGTFDGTNNTATFNALGETLTLFGISDTQFVIITNTGSVAMSAV